MSILVPPRFPSAHSSAWTYKTPFATLPGKHGFVTPRDLFRWAERHSTGYEELARDGFLLLGERLRDEAEKQVVKSVLEKQMRVKLDLATLHEVSGQRSI
jgi:midasin